FFLRGLQYHGQVPEAPIVDEKTEWLDPQAAPSDVRMSINPVTAGFLAIVDVKSLESAKADDSVKRPHRRSILVFRRKSVARREHVTCIQADAQPLRLLNHFENASQMLESMSQR